MRETFLTSMMPAMSAAPGSCGVEVWGFSNAPLVGFCCSPSVADGQYGVPLYGETSDVNQTCPGQTGLDQAPVKRVQTPSPGRDGGRGDPLFPESA